MSGYLNKREETASVIDDEGWCRTGDMGRLDEVCVCVCVCVCVRVCACLCACMHVCEKCCLVNLVCAMYICAYTVYTGWVSILVWQNQR